MKLVYIDLGNSFIMLNIDEVVCIRYDNDDEKISIRYKTGDSGTILNPPNKDIDIRTIFYELTNILKRRQKLLFKDDSIIHVPSINIPASEVDDYINNIIQE